MKISQTFLLATSATVLVFGLASGASGGVHSGVHFKIESHLAALTTDPSGQIIALWSSRRCDAGACRTRVLVGRFLGDGQLDRSFSRNGRVTLRTGGGGGPYLRDVETQPDGSVLVGWGQLIIRLGADGKFDQNFGVGGYATVDERIWANFSKDMVALPDGGFAIAGTDLSSGGKFSVARYDAGGQPVESFGDHGLASWSAGDQDGTVTAAAVGPDGALLVAGEVRTGDYERSFAVSRLLADGTLDSGFGDQGTALFAPYGSLGGTAAAISRPTAVLSGPDGQIVVVGVQNQGEHGGCERTRIGRLNSDGTLDPAFGTGGLTTDTPPCTWPSGAAVSPGGDVFTAGNEFNYFESDLPFHVAKYTNAGAFDPSFGDRGFTDSRFYRRLPSYVADGAGHRNGFVVGGDVVSENCAAGHSAHDVRCSSIALRRFKGDGTINRRFGRRGLVAMPWVHQS